MFIGDFERKKHDTMGEAWAAPFHNHNRDEPCDGRYHSSIWIFDRGVITNYDGNPVGDPLMIVRNAIREFAVRMKQMEIVLAEKGIRFQ